MSARQCATLPRKMTLGNKMPAPMPPRRDPKTTLSVGRARFVLLPTYLHLAREGNYKFRFFFVR